MTIIASELSYAVRLPVLAKYLGLLAFMLALLTLVPLGAAVLFQDYQIAFRYVAVISLLFFLWGASRRIVEPRLIQTNEALSIVALAFVLSPLLMSLPFMAGGLCFSNALFEAVSAITTTGLSMVTELESQPASFLFARAWMQWYGGLGIVVLSVAIVMGHHVTSRSLSEPLGGETLATTTSTHARKILIIYGALTVLGFIVIWPISGNGLSALHHVLAAISTGGFSSYDSSLAGIDSWYARFAIITLSICGALPLVLYTVIFSKNWRTGIFDAELLALLVAIILVSFCLFLSLKSISGMLLEDAVRHSILLAVSAQTTAGFTSLDINTLDNSGKLSLIIAMLMGGSVGSTAGGIKLLRLLILFRLIQVLLQRTTMPAQAVYYPKLSGRILEDLEIQRVLMLILLFIGVVVGSWLIFVSYDYSPMNALFEVVSATATVGLSTGITAANMPLLLKWVLCLDMLFGRVEIVALLVLLYPRNWIGKRKELI